MGPTSREEIARLLGLANIHARQELIVAAREPGRQLVTLLKNRSAQLAQREADEAELDEIADTLGASASSPIWGMF